MGVFRNFRNNIKHLVKEEKTSLADLSKRSGISRSLLYGYVEGKTTPSLEQVEKIAIAMGLAVSELIGDEKPEFKAPPRDPLEDFKREALVSLLRAKPEQWASLRPALIAVFPRLAESTAKEHKQSG